MGELKTSVKNAIEAFKVSDACDLTINACRRTNKWIADLEPWKMKAEEQAPLRAACLRVLLEAIYVLGHFFAPYTPSAAEAIFKKLQTEPVQIASLNDAFK